MIDDDGRKLLKSGTQHAAVGIEIAACLLIGFFGGRWLDATFGTEPYLMTFGGIVGLIAAIKVIHRIIKRTDLDKL